MPGIKVFAFESLIAKQGNSHFQLFKYNNWIQIMTVYSECFGGIALWAALPAKGKVNGERDSNLKRYKKMCKTMNINTI